MTEKKRVTVREVMKLQYDVVDGMMSVQDALKAMQYKNNKSLIVEKRDDNDEYGMVLISDIAKQVLAKDRSPERVNVYEIMAKPVISVRPDMNTRYCARLFDNFGINHAPVIENEEVLGIISYYLIALQGLPSLD